MPLKDGALIIELAGTSVDTELNFETAQGDFGCRLGEVGLGTRLPFLDGLVKISRMANSAVILSAPSEDDYASAAVGPFYCPADQQVNRLLNQRMGREVAVQLL